MGPGHPNGPGCLRYKVLRGMYKKAAGRSLNMARIPVIQLHCAETSEGWGRPQEQPWPGFQSELARFPAACRWHLASRNSDVGLPGRPVTVAMIVLVPSVSSANSTRSPSFKATGPCSETEFLPPNAETTWDMAAWKVGASHFSF